MVGTRKHSNYMRQFTCILAKALAKRGVCVVSGAVIGERWHNSTLRAGEGNTIAVVANRLDIRYPAINKNLIAGIEKQGPLLSQFNDGFRTTGWSFSTKRTGSGPWRYTQIKDDSFYFCQSGPTIDESFEKFGDGVYEAEIEGFITIQNGIVRLG